MSVNRILILDTNVLYNDWYMKQAHIVSLEIFVRNDELQIVIPEVVLIELKNKFKYYLKKHISDLNKSKIPFQRLVDFEIKTPSETHLDSLFEKYCQHLDSRLRKLQVEIIRVPNTTHSIILDRIYTCKKPFKKPDLRKDKINFGDQGYKDYLIWESILKHLISKKDNIVFFISNDNAFFNSNESDLHEDLYKDLDSLKISRNNIHHFSNLNSFYGYYIETYHKELIAIIKEEPFDLEKIFKDKEDLIIESISQEAESYLSQKVSDDIQVLMICQVDLINHFYSNTIKSDLLNMYFQAIIWINADCIVFKGDIYAYDSDLEGIEISVNDWEWNNHYADANISFKLPVSVVVSWNDKKRELVAIEIEGLDYSILYYCPNCEYPITSDSAEYCPKCSKSFIPA